MTDVFFPLLDSELVGLGKVWHMVYQTGPTSDWLLANKFIKPRYVRHTSNWKRWSSNIFGDYSHCYTMLHPSRKKTQQQVPHQPQPTTGTRQLRKVCWSSFPPSDRWRTFASCAKAPMATAVSGAWDGHGADWGSGGYMPFTNSIWLFKMDQNGPFRDHRKVDV